MIEDTVRGIADNGLHEWDPEDHERCWMSHSITGEKGWLCKRNGRVHVRYSHGDRETTRPYNAQDWLVEKQHRQFSRDQVVRVAFEADRELCKLIGERRLAMRTWGKLSDAQRRSWVERGPQSHKLRKEVYAMIVEKLFPERQAT